MSRSINKGLDYTSLDVTFFQDRKIRRLQRKVDEYAPLVYIALLCTIFKEGYYIQWDDDVAMDLADASHLNEEYVSRVIDACLETELLSREMFEQHRILTSVGIQRQYKISCEKMKRKSTVDEYSLLIPSENKPILPNNSEEISETSEDNGQTSEEMKQSKVKETKGKEIEESKDSFSSSSSPSSEVAPSEDEKQEEKILSYMFFNNWAAPNKEYLEFKAFNNTGDRCWAKMDKTQRMSALILWKQKPEQPKRFGDIYLKFWQKVFSHMQILNAPHTVIMHTLADDIRFDEKSGKATLFCADDVRAFIEKNLDAGFRQIIQKYLFQARHLNGLSYMTYNPQQ